MKCLKCYNKLDENQKYYHHKCLKNFFGNINIPQIDIDNENIVLGEETIVNHKLSLTGVQRKFSAGYQNNKKNEITITGYETNFILKLPSTSFKEIVFNEDLTMNLAKLSGIKTVEHIVIPFGSDYAYLTKRIDRKENKKLHLEDFCQLSEKQTENKYHGSLELISRKLKEFSDLANFDLHTLFELAIFNFLIGNNDMHLKNYSLLYDRITSLSPAYDLLNTSLYISKKDDSEDFALTMNGKKNNFNLKDFVHFGNYLELNEPQINNVFKKFKNINNLFVETIDKSFLSNKNKKDYKNIYESNFKIFEN